MFSPTTNTQDPVVFKAYKPFRNAIRTLALADSLAVIRTYISNLQFNEDFPADCEVHTEYLSRRSHAERANMVSEFHLEALRREVILNAIEIGHPKKTLKHWNTLARIVNHLRDLEQFIASRYRTSALLMHDLHRMVHRQLPWQASRPSAVNITRYYMIYEYPPLKSIIHSGIGLSPEELFLYGMALLGNFKQAFALHCPPDIQIPGLSPDGLHRFLHHFSRNLSDLKKLLLGEHQMNDRFAYAYNSLRAYPVIKMIHKGNNSLVCPIPTLLFWRFTSGVYYEICNQPGFDNAFGEAFQWYVGRVLEEGTRREKTRIYPERKYRVGKDLKLTVDWIMDQDGAAIFVEAKTKRMAQEVKVEIVQEAVLPKELAKLADMIVQVYKSIRDYLTGCYPDYPFDAQRKIYPVV